MSGLIMRLIARAIVAVSIVLLVLSGRFQLTEAIMLTFAVISIDVLIENHLSRGKE